jgi:NAD(P)-dependent dehydrogenase (short-subunit alcohol dehydrogenase family)
MQDIQKIVLVTGGSRGLWKDSALSLAKKWFDVIITYHTKKEEAEWVVSEIELLGQRASLLHLDLSDTLWLDEFMTSLHSLMKEKFHTDKIDYLVNNAGIGIHSEISDMTESQFDLLFNIHLKAPFFLTQKILPMMRDGGGIVNISTGLTRFIFWGYAAYSAMKGAMEVMTKYQAKELWSRGIRSNIVAPGAIETDFWGGMVRDNPQVNQSVASGISLGRVGRPDDIGGVVAFLCSDEAKWITAQRIEVSWGQSL